mgnify:CR=1 FL=1
MSTNKYATRTELHRQNRNDEKAICDDYFSRIFKTNRKLDERGQLVINFEMISNAGEHIPKLCNNEVFESIIGNLVAAENEKLKENPNADRGLNSRNFYDVISTTFLPCHHLPNGRIDKVTEEELDNQLECMFEDLAPKGFIGFNEVHDLMHDIREDCSHSTHSKEELKEIIASCGNDPRGLNKEEFMKLMKSEQF